MFSNIWSLTNFLITSIFIPPLHEGIGLKNFNSNHAIPGSNRIFQIWTGNMQKSDIFAKKYRKQMKNNACTSKLWKSRLIYLGVHPQIC